MQTDPEMSQVVKLINEDIKIIIIAIIHILKKEENMSMLRKTWKILFKLKF